MTWLEQFQAEYIAWLHGDRDPVVKERALVFAARQDADQDVCE